MTRAQRQVDNIGDCGDNDRDEMRVMRGVVYIMKSKGPRTEPRGTPYSEVYKEEKQSLHFTQKVRDQLRTEP